MYKKYQKAGNARHYAKPYQRLYKRLQLGGKDREIPVKITYEQYINIIKKNPKCYYCNDKLKWVKHGTKSVRVNLDRKNHHSDYNIRNVVASCWRCNNARGTGFSSKDWFTMTEFLRFKNQNKKRK